MGSGHEKALTKLVQKYTRKTPRPLSHCCPSHPDLSSDGQADSSSPRVSPWKREPKGLWESLPAGDSARQSRMVIYNNRVFTEDFAYHL